jgi:hypothetical protein
VSFIVTPLNPLKAELIPISYLLALLGAHHFLRVGSIRVNNGSVKANAISNGDGSDVQF